MKKILLTLALSISMFAAAQVPQGISYQAVALNGSSAVTNSNVGIKLSILNNTSTGPVLYTETHVKMTNAQGLFNLVIGQGTPTTGTFAAINWGGGSKFLKVEMDIAGGTNYALVGTTQLLSVPYAMYAASTASVPATALNGVGSSSLKGTSYLILDGSSVKGYYNGAWATQACSQQIYSDDIVQQNGSFMVLDGSNVRCFSKGVWATQAFPGQVYTDDVMLSNDAFLVLGSGNQVRGFANGIWATQTFSQQMYMDDVLSSEGAFIVLDGTSIKAFYNGVWTTQAFTQQIYTDDVEVSNGNFLIRDNNTVKSFYKGVWATQSFSQQIYSDDFVPSMTE